MRTRGGQDPARRGVWPGFRWAPSVADLWIGCLGFRWVVVRLLEKVGKRLEALLTGWRVAAYIRLTNEGGAPLAPMSSPL
jgi:hypothetical protein